MTPLSACLSACRCVLELSWLIAVALISPLCGHAAITLPDLFILGHNLRRT